MAYTSADYIYDKIGITSTEIPSAQMDRILEEVDREVDRIIKTTCVPKKVIDIFTGDDKNIHVVGNIPLLNVEKLEIDATDISLSKLIFNPTGLVQLKNTAEQPYFYYNSTPHNCYLKYYYGWLEETTTQTDIATAVTAGTGAVISVDSSTGFAADDWIKIVGFDGNREVTKITSVATGTITCDLILGHEVDSLITKLQVPGIVQTLAAVIGAIMGALKMIGSTYTFATSYAVPDHSVTKGVPYPHFNRNMEGWIKERDFIMSNLPSWPVFS